MTEQISDSLFFVKFDRYSHRYYLHNKESFEYYKNYPDLQFFKADKNRYGNPIPGDLILDMGDK